MKTSNRMTFTHFQQTDISESSTSVPDGNLVDGLPPALVIISGMASGNLIDVDTGRKSDRGQPTDLKPWRPYVGSTASLAKPQRLLVELQLQAGRVIHNRFGARDWKTLNWREPPDGMFSRTSR